jgi:hypothetical protein
MVSDKFKFANNSPDSSRIPLSVEKFAEFSGLSPTNSRLLSLLSEEMIGMIKSILPDFTAELYASNERNKYELVLAVSAVIKSKDRDSLLKASGGKNSAYGGGLLGKIGDLLVDWTISLNDNPTPVLAYPDMELGMGMGMVNGYEEWSMRMYLDSMQNKPQTPDLVDDGLERSIIVKLADDCKVSVKSGSVIITVSKAFEETGFKSAN